MLVRPVIVVVFLSDLPFLVASIFEDFGRLFDGDDLLIATFLKGYFTEQHAILSSKVASHVFPLQTAAKHATKTAFIGMPKESGSCLVVTTIVADSKRRCSTRDGTLSNHLLLTPTSSCFVCFGVADLFASSFLLFHT